MGQNFYDKIAKKFGGYRTGAQSKKVAPHGSEEIFKEKIIALCSGKIALDVGCADGRFTVSVAPYFKKIVAIDASVEMLKVARKLKEKNKVGNVHFEYADAFNTGYQENSFDLVYNRRGPSVFSEAYRLLKHGGYYIEIGIGEKDCMGIKKIFGRGQDYGTWDQPRLELKKQAMEKIGFKIIFEKDIFYDEYYPTYGDLNLFLQGVPIFEDFNPDKDKQFLESYQKIFTTNEGIKLPRHRVLVIGEKL